MNQEFYSEEDATQILQTAVRLDGRIGAVSEDRLMQMAAEAGISADAVKAAREELAAQKVRAAEVANEEVLRSEFRARQRSKLKQELGSYAGTSIVLLGINALTGGFEEGIRHWWSLWVVGIWGLVLIGQVMEFIFARPDRDEVKFQRWRERKMQGLPEDLSERTVGLAYRVGRVEGPVPDVSEVLDPYAKVLGAGKKLEAIKLVRNEMGLDLRSAKKAVDQYYRDRKNG